MLILHEKKEHKMDFIKLFFFLGLNQAHEMCYLRRQQLRKNLMDKRKFPSPTTLAALLYSSVQRMQPGL